MKKIIKDVLDISKILHRDIEFVYSKDTGDECWFDRESGKICINVNSDNFTSDYIGILVHDITHTIEGTRGYGKLYNMVIKKQSASQLEEQQAVWSGRYDARGKKISPEAANREIVADYVRHNLFTDKNAITEAVKLDRSFGTTMKGILDRMLSLFGNKNARERVFLARARRYYAEALNQSGTVARSESNTDAYYEYTEQHSYSDEVKADNVSTSKNNEDALTQKQIFSKDFEENVLTSFEIADITDFIHIQRQVLTTLIGENFFTDSENRRRFDVNKGSGMIIETNKSGIDETFSFNNFIRLGKFKKISKLATIRMLPSIIRDGRIIDDNVKNKYNDGKNKTYAYIEHKVNIDGKNIVVKLAIKKSPQKNKFWVHSIYTTENVSDSPASTNNNGAEAGHITADNGKIVAQPTQKVNKNSKNDFENSSHSYSNAAPVTSSTPVIDSTPKVVQNNISRTEAAHRNDIGNIFAIPANHRKMQLNISPTRKGGFS